jgi:hypothetical protein
MYALLKLIDLIVKRLDLVSNDVQSFVRELYVTRYEKALDYDKLLAAVNLDLYTERLCENSTSVMWSWPLCSCVSQLNLNETKDSIIHPSLLIHIKFDTAFTAKAVLFAQQIHQHSTRLNISNAVLQVVLEDSVEQWVNFLLPEVHTPLFVAYSSSCTYHMK